MIHGDLKVSTDGHRIEHDDGFPLFLLGDTAWRLPSLKPEDLEKYLAVRAEQGFNIVLFNMTGMKAPNYRGDWPFHGGEPPWSEFSPVEEYWEHIDLAFDIAERLGVYMLALPWWGPNANSDDDRLFFANPDGLNVEFGRFIGDRYGSRPNIIWCLAGEYTKPYRHETPRPLPESHITRIEAIADGILATASERRLMTVHPGGLYSSSDDFHGRDWLDFNMVQTHKGFDYIVPMVTADYNLRPEKPVLSSEGWYEGEPGMYDLPAWDDINAGWLQRMQAYWSVFHGSFGFAYGHKLVWRMTDEQDNHGVLFLGAITSPAATCLRHLRALMESEPDIRWQPHQSFLTTGTRGSDFGRFYGTSPSLNCALRATDGIAAMIYSTRGMNFCARMSGLAQGTATATWFDPRTGERRPDARKAVASGPAAPNTWFHPPGKEDDGNDWVLMLKVSPGS